MKPVSEAVKIYDTILSIPGMQDEIKLQSRIPRKNVLLLHQLIERGLAPDGEVGNMSLMEVLPKDSVQLIRDTVQDWLRQAGLAELHEKLKTLG